MLSSLSGAGQFTDERLVTCDFSPFLALLLSFFHSFFAFL